jgi:hypothetical protein
MSESLVLTGPGTKKFVNCQNTLRVANRSNITKV